MSFRPPFLRGKSGVFVLTLLVALMALRTRYSVTITWGESMAPTFAHGDLLIVDRWAYRAATPERGDIVIARARNDLLVKRVAGLPGEIVELRAGILHINGVAYSEEYASATKILEIHRGLLAANRYALVGDNRSMTSRELVHAVAAKEAIVGRVLFSIPVPRLG